MNKSAHIMTSDEMREVAQLIPTFNEQLRAKVQKSLADGHGVLTAFCRQVNPAKRFRLKVGAFGRGEIQHLDLYEMVHLYAVMADMPRPRSLLPNPLGIAGNGRKKGQGFPAPKRTGAPLAHPGLKDD